MPINRRLLSAFLLLVSLCGALPGALSAQDKLFELRYWTPEKLERPTKADEQGVLQWAPMPEVPCPSCNGKKETRCTTCQRMDDSKKCIECAAKKVAVCRTCAGHGQMPDPLQVVHCPGCMAAGFVVCAMCQGGGQIKTEGGGDRWGTCPCCRGSGGWKCEYCNGQRTIATAKLKGGMAEAPLAELQKALKAVTGVMTVIETLQPDGHNTRKVVKEYSKQLQPLAAYYPPFKTAAKFLDDVVLGGLGGGNGYMGHGEREGNTINNFKACNQYFLKHQKRMLELCIERAEANAKVTGDKKDGK